MLLSSQTGLQVKDSALTLHMYSQSLVKSWKTATLAMCIKSHVSDTFATNLYGSHAMLLHSKATYVLGLMCANRCSMSCGSTGVLSSQNSAYLLDELAHSDTRSTSINSDASEDACSFCDLLDARLPYSIVRRREERVGGRGGG